MYWRTRADVESRSIGATTSGSAADSVPENPPVRRPSGGSPVESIHLDRMVDRAGRVRRQQDAQHDLALHEAGRAIVDVPDQGERADAVTRRQGFDATAVDPVDPAGAGVYLTFGAEWLCGMCWRDCQRDRE
jgi:hypothetical protein